MSELKSLANSEQFPAGKRVSIMREMVISSNSKFPADNGRRFVYAWDGEVFICARETGPRIKTWPHAAEIHAKKMRPMTAKEIAMLPRGTCVVFATNQYGPIYNLSPRIIGDRITISGYNIETFSGYLLPTDQDDMEPRRFEVESVE